MTRDDILRTAQTIINGERNQQYGDFRVQSVRLAMVWQAATGLPIQPHHVGPILMGLKLVRSTTAADTDSEVDLAGYAALHAEAFKAPAPEAADLMAAGPEEQPEPAPAPETTANLRG